MTVCSTPHTERANLLHGVRRPCEVVAIAGVFVGIRVTLEWLVGIREEVDIFFLKVRDVVIVRTELMFSMMMEHLIVFGGAAGFVAPVLGLA